MFRAKKCREWYQQLKEARRLGDKETEQYLQENKPDDRSKGDEFNWRLTYRSSAHTLFDTEDFRNSISYRMHMKTNAREDLATASFSAFANLENEKAEQVENSGKPQIQRRISKRRMSAYKHLGLKIQHVEAEQVGNSGKRKIQRSISKKRMSVYENLHF